MTAISTLIDTALSSILLKILVFGPQTTVISDNDRIKALQLKRVEIKNELVRLGHQAHFAEDVVDPGISGPSGNFFFQEIILMQEYDFIVNLVESPGSNIEASCIATKPELAKKAHLFMDIQFKDGLAAAACRHAMTFGAQFNTYEHPKDLDECNLMGFVTESVKKIQLINYLS